MSTVCLCVFVNFFSLYHMGCLSELNVLDYYVQSFLVIFCLIK